MSLLPRHLVPLSVLLAAALLGACSQPTSPPQAPAEVSFQARLPQGLSAADVMRVSVRVSGPGIPAPLEFALSRAEDTWHGTLSDIPAGTQRRFDAAAYDAEGVVLYRGSSGPVTLEGGNGAPAVVAVMMQQLNPPPAFENTAPQVDALVVSHAQVVPGAALTLSARAHDADSGDAVTFAWSSSDGAFSAPDSAETRWTAPATEGTYRLDLTVTDRQAARATIGLDIRVARSAGTGSAVITVSANTWPSVTGMNALPSVLGVAQPVSLSASANDPDGDAVLYAWASSCEGSFGSAGSAASTFTLGALPASGRCAFTVTVTDGRGGRGTGTLSLLAGTAVQPNFAPQVLSTYKSHEAVLGGETVRLRLSAHDPEGTELRFSWASVEGVLGTPFSTADSSEVSWTAPSCFDAPQSISATVVDATGVATSQEFQVAALDETPCSGTTVRGTQVQHYVQVDNSVVQRATDLRATVVGAWVTRADGSGQDFIPGEGHADGTFAIYGVERTPYVLQLGTSYYPLHGRNVDLSYPLLGRPDVAAAPADTQLHFAFTGLVPWTPNDDIQLSAPAAGVGYSSLICSSTFPPAESEGGTALEATFPYSSFPCGVGIPAPLLDLSRGDSFYATQLAARPVAAGAASLQELRRAAELSPLLVNGTYELVSELRPLPLQRLTFDVRNAEFDAFAAQMHPAGQLLAGNAFGVGVGPLAAGFGLPGGWPDLAMGSVTGVGAPDFVEEAEFGNPYPGVWPHLAHASAASSLRVRVYRPDGSSASRTLFGSVYVMQQLPTPLPSAVTLRPTLSPPRDLTLDGVPATSQLSGVGATPVLAWDAPGTGTPSHYRVRLYEYTLPATGTFLDRRTAGTWITQERSLRLPPGVLRSGNTYAFLITAEQRADFDPQAPLRGGPTAVRAEAFTSPFVP